MNLFKHKGSVLRHVFRKWGWTLDILNSEESLFKRQFIQNCQGADLSFEQRFNKLEFRDWSSQRKWQFKSSELSTLWSFLLDPKFHFLEVASSKKPFKS